LNNTVFHGPYLAADAPEVLFDASKNAQKQPFWAATPTQTGNL
jgi:hypothetical protein